MKTYYIKSAEMFEKWLGTHLYMGSLKNKYCDKIFDFKVWQLKEEFLQVHKNKEYPGKLINRGKIDEYGEIVYRTSGTLKKDSIEIIKSGKPQEEIMISTYIMRHGGIFPGYSRHATIIIPTNPKSWRELWMEVKESSD